METAEPAIEHQPLSSRSLSVASYIAILFVLIILTLLTVALSFFELGRDWHVIAGLTIAGVKAALVILFFMHALSSPRLTWCVIVAAIFWVVILFSLTYADYWTRGIIPEMPGH
jgi:cytochrome c oxidase subunit IV